jgi:hypothetical protein
MVAITRPHPIDAKSYQNCAGSKTLGKIHQAAKTSLKCIQQLFLFPKRFIGAKDWSLPGLILQTPVYLLHKILGKPYVGLFGQSYHRFFEKQISVVEAKKFLPFVAASVGTDSEEKFLHPCSLRSIDLCALNLDLKGVKILHNSLIEARSGIKISVLENASSEIIIAFGAKHSAKMVFGDDHAGYQQFEKAQSRNIAQNLAGCLPASHKKSKQIIEHLLTLPYFINKKITLTGTCFGASLAQYTGLKLGIKAVCFNSLQLGQAAQQDIGYEKLAQADFWIEHVSTRKDFLNDSQIYNRANHILSFIGIKTPGNFGRQYCIPSAYTDSSKSHVFIMGSFMKYLGFNERSLPKDLPENYLK